MLLVDFVFRFLKFYFLFDLALILFGFTLNIFTELLGTKNTSLLNDISLYSCSLQPIDQIIPFNIQHTIYDLSMCFPLLLFPEIEHFPVVGLLHFFDLCFCQIIN